MNGGKTMNPRARYGQSACAVMMTVGISVLGCATTGGGGGGEVPKEAAPPIVDPVGKDGAPMLFVAMPNSPDFVAVRKGLVSEVQKTFNVKTFVVSGETKDADFAAALETAKPVCVVLMNNGTMNLFHRYEEAHAGAKQIPTVVVMASFLEEVRGKLKHATGIAYEVPGVTAFVNLRSVVKTPVTKVGVVYRPVFKKFIERQKALAAKENVELIPVSIAADISASGLRDTLSAMVKTNKVDAVWMLNDNTLLRDGTFLNEAWHAALAEANVPLIVGVPNLVDPASPLGTLAVVPDHEGLGFQAANLIFDLLDSDWDVDGHAVELPLSVKTVVDVKSVKASFGLREDALRHIDKALE